MQYDNTNDSGLEDFQPVGGGETAGAGSRSVHSLALQQENDGQSGFNGIVESDREQITKGRSKVQRHLLPTPFEEFFQRNDREEAYCPEEINQVSRQGMDFDPKDRTYMQKSSFGPIVGSEKSKPTV